jgi:nitrite reductase (NO-forming)
MNAFANELKMKTKTLKKVCAVVLGFAWLAASAQVPDSEVSGVENAVLTQAPNVPPPITRKYATKVVINLEVTEVTKTLADGVEYTFWTFGGNVPGKFIRVREGDLVEFHLHNNQNNKMPHNIDLHAVSGPGGGAASSFTAPGHSSQFSFQALNPGLFVYHCATAPVGMHIANGMYGLILVQPKEGLPPVDHEYYVMQGEFYTPGKFGEEGYQTFDLDKAVDERPSYVLFNGAVGSLSGDHALTAVAGDTVRIFFGNGGPNLASSFHIIGAQFETLYQDGSMTNQLHGVQTTLVPPGSAVIVDCKLHVPGTYTLVDHSIFRAFNKGAVGSIVVSGSEDKMVYSGKQSDTLFTGAEITSVAIPIAKTTATAETHALPARLNEAYDRGKAVYMQTCFVCHQPNGLGVGNQIPPLAKSDVLMGDKAGVIKGVLQGRSGELIVNGKKFDAPMIPFAATLSDQQIADALTFARNSWGNADTNGITPDEVHSVRSKVPANLAASSSPYE